MRETRKWQKGLKKAQHAKLSKREFERSLREALQRTRQFDKALGRPCAWQTRLRIVR